MSVVPPLPTDPVTPTPSPTPAPLPAVPTPAPVPSCPACGKPLAPVAHGPASAPWLCYESGRGFFSAELTTEARAIYRPTYNDWGFGQAALAVRAQVATELAEAVTRGTSLRPDQLGVATPEQLAFVATLPLDSAFAPYVQAALAAATSKPAVA